MSLNDSSAIFKGCEQSTITHAHSTQTRSCSDITLVKTSVLPFRRFLNKIYYSVSKVNRKGWSPNFPEGNSIRALSPHTPINATGDVTQRRPARCPVHDVQSANSPTSQPAGRMRPVGSLSARLRHGADRAPRGCQDRRRSRSMRPVSFMLVFTRRDNSWLHLILHVTVCSGTAVHFAVRRHLLHTRGSATHHARSRCISLSLSSPLSLLPPPSLSLYLRGWAGEEKLN